MQYSWVFFFFCCSSLNFTSTNTQIFLFFSRKAESRVLCSTEGNSHHLHPWSSLANRCRDFPACLSHQVPACYIFFWYVLLLLLHILLQLPSAWRHQVFFAISTTGKIPKVVPWKSKDLLACSQERCTQTRPWSPHKGLQNLWDPPQHFTQ